MKKFCVSDRSKVFIGCFLCMFIVQGGLQSFPVFMPQVAAETGWSLTDVAIGSTTATVGAFIANLFLQKLLKKTALKKIILIGIFFLSFHFGLYSFCRSIYGFWFAAFLGGGAIGWATVSTCSIEITHWFDKNRSQYIALIISASMLGSVLLNPFAASLIDLLGWRRAYQVMALCLGSLGICSVVFLVKDIPNSSRPYPADDENSKKTFIGYTGQDDLRSVKRSAPYALMLAGIFLIGLSTNVENYLPAFFQSKGMTSIRSSLVISIYSLYAAVGTYVMSRVNDRLGGKRFVLLTSACFIMAVAVFALTDVNKYMPLLLLILVPFALGAKKASGMTPPLVVAERFGTENYPLIIGSFSASLQIGIGTSNFIIGRLIDISYETMFIIMASVNAIAVSLVFSSMRSRFR